MITISFDDSELRKQLGSKSTKIITDINKQLKKQPSDKFVRKHFKFQNAKELDKDIAEKDCKNLDEYLKKHSKFKGEKDFVERIVKEEIKL